MPCNSDYLEPTHRERELQRAAKLYVYVLAKAGMPRSDIAERSAAHHYCSTDFVPALCQVLRSLEPEAMDHIVYNARDPMARDLADWWEAHQRADELRQLEQNEAARKKQLRRAALSKLTKEERRALGLEN